MHFEPDFENKLALDEDTFETMKAMASMIERENRSIMSKYNQSLRDAQEDTTTIEAVVSSSSDLSEDFEDQ